MAVEPVQRGIRFREGRREREYDSGKTKVRAPHIVARAACLCRASHLLWRSSWQVTEVQIRECSPLVSQKSHLHFMVDFKKYLLNLRPWPGQLIISGFFVFVFDFFLTSDSLICKHWDYSFWILWYICNKLQQILNHGRFLIKPILYPFLLLSWEAQM